MIPWNKFMEYEGLTEKIIGCAYSVYDKMGFGFLEPPPEPSPSMGEGWVGLTEQAQQ
jgi:hypothetical protein